MYQVASSSTDVTSQSTSMTTDSDESDAATERENTHQKDANPMKTKLLVLVIYHHNVLNCMCKSSISQLNETFHSSTDI